MSEEPQIDSAGGDMALIKAAAVLIEGAKETSDPRVIELAGKVIAELKKGEILETLLVAFAESQNQPAMPAGPMDMQALIAKNVERMQRTR